MFSSANSMLSVKISHYRFKIVEFGSVTPRQGLCPVTLRSQIKFPVLQREETEEKRKKRKERKGRINQGNMERGGRRRIITLKDLFQTQWNEI